MLFLLSLLYTVVDGNLKAKIYLVKHFYPTSIVSIDQYLLQATPYCSTFLVPHGTIINTY